MALLYRHQLQSLVAMFCLAGLIWLFHAVYFPTAADGLALWFACMTTIFLGRAWLGFRFAARPLPPEDDAGIWLGRMRLGVMFTGAGWGALSPLVLPGAPVESAMFVMLVLAGVGAGAASVLSPYRHLFELYAALIYVPLVLTLFQLTGTTHTTFALVTVIFVLILARSANVMNQTLAESLRQRFAKEEALESADAALAVSAEANRLLTEEIAQRQFAELGLSRARVEAEAANRAKSLFLAHMSHEMRTPMNGILGMTELVLETRLDDEQKDYLQTIQDSARRLHNAISGVLQYVALESGDFRLSPATASTAEMLRTATEQCRPDAIAKSLSLTVDIVPDVPENVVVDAELFRLALGALLDNAIKFTRAGGEIKVRLQGEADAPDGKTLHLSVADTGIGIPQDKLENLFKIFNQIDNGYARNYEGLGLGLALTARIAAAMGGRVWAESAEGQGSCFHFVFRYEAV